MSFENVDDIYVLSPLQQGMLFHELYTPGSEAYTFQTSWTLSGTFNSSLLRLSWQKVVDQHPVLRTSFVWEGLEKPLQVVHQRIEVPWEQHDWRSLPAREQDMRWEQFLVADRSRAFPLDEAPLMRLALFQITENVYRLVWSYHHLLLDGWSYPQVLKEVLDIYNALVQGTTLTPVKRRPYRDYIAWLQEQDLSQAEAFWRQRLKGFIAPTRLTVDQMPGTSVGQRFAEQRWVIPAEITTALQAFARMHQLTLNTLVQGAWALLLSYYSEELDLVYGTVVSGRPVSLAGMESMIGLFVNTLPVRVRLSAEETLLSWLKALQLQQVELRQYEYSPLVQVQHWSDVPHGSPLFESILAFENYPTGMLTPEQESGLTLTSLSSFGHTHYPLELIVIPRDTLTLRLSYATGRFAAETMERLPGHFQNLLEGMLMHATQPLAALSILSTVERQMMLKTWNATSQPGVAADGLQAGICLHHLVEAQVERTPDALAVTFEQQRLTYRQLNERANQLAHHLRRLGIGTESIVGVFMERSLDMVIALLGILKAGGAYTPLDPAFPSERLAFVLTDLKADTANQATVLLTQGHLVASLPLQDAHIICLDTFWDQLSLERSDNLAGDVVGANLAYVIYTSGSTGQPKGVMNSHQGICNRLLWMQTVSPLSAVDCVMQKTPFSFDISVWEFFWPLITGARLAVARPGGQKESAYLIELIQQQQVTTLHFVPSMLQIFLEEPGLEACSSLRQVICSGEELSYALQERFFLHHPAMLYNLYGPTEAAVEVTSWLCQPQNPRRVVPIGHPITNIQIYILNCYGQPVPVGVQGELYIGGVGVARGYLNRPDLTAERFVPDPFSQQPGTRLYRTGDLARYLPDGAIEYLGRIDHQIKLRGFRVELGEIEIALGQHPTVRSGVVALREDQPDDKRLVAYLVPRSQDGESQRPSPGELASYLRKWLPEYMLPASYIWLDALPLLPNGKVDRHALPTPGNNQQKEINAYVAPRTLVEQKLAELWENLFRLEQVSATASFFDLGGHSLLALRLIGQIRAALQIQLSLHELFEHPTVATLALVVVQKQLEQRDSSEIERLLAAIENTAGNQ